MKNSGGQKRGLTSRMVFGTLVIFVTSVWLYSSGDVFHLEADPMAVDALPGHLVTVSLARPASTLEVDLVVRLESLNPEIALVPESVVIPRGATSSQIPVAPLRSGTANIRASAELFGDVVFTINVLDGPGPLEQVNPETIRLRLARGETAMVPVSVQVPPDTIPTVVDLVFAVDGPSKLYRRRRQTARRCPVHRFYPEKHVSADQFLFRGHKVSGLRRPRQDLPSGHNSGPRRRF